jgi:hypothetical protein
LDADEGDAHLNGRITSLDEYRFVLYRHWNLYESMYHSRYVATKLEIWKQNGRKRLDTLLAKMGLPLDECKQKYPAMNSELKKKMKELFSRYAPDFGLRDLCYQSFQRVILNSTVGIQSLIFHCCSNADLKNNNPPPTLYMPSPLSWSLMQQMMKMMQILNHLLGKQISGRLMMLWIRMYMYNILLF